MRFTIKQKLASTFAVIILLSGIAAWVGANGLATIDDSMKAVLNGPVNRMERINQIHILFNTMLRYDKNVVMAGNLNEAKKFEELARQVRQELLSKAEEYSHLVTLADDRSRLEELRHLFSQYVTVQDKIHEDGLHDTNAEAAVLSEKQGQTDELEALLQQLHERLAAREPVLETQNASGATLTMAKELEQLLTDERNLMLATTDAEMVPTQQKLKASVAAIAKQRETFRRLPDAQDRALAEQFFERFEKRDYRAREGRFLGGRKHKDEGRPALHGRGRKARHTDHQTNRWHDGNSSQVLGRNEG